MGIKNATIYPGVTPILSAVTRLLDHHELGIQHHNAKRGLGRL